MTSYFRRVDRVRSLLAVAALAASLQGCAFRLEILDGDESSGSDVTGLPDASLADPSSGVPDFETVRKAVLKPACTSCHGTKEPVLLTYEQVIENLDEIEESVFVNGTMPKGRTLSAANLDLLKRWIDGGAPLNVAPKPVASASPVPADGGSASGPAVLRPVSFAVLKEQVLDPSCNSCHYPDNTDGITELTTYESTKSVSGMLVATTLVEPMMPPPDTPGVDPLTQEQKDWIALWAADGMRE